MESVDPLFWEEPPGFPDGGGPLSGGAVDAVGKGVTVMALSARLVCQPPYMTVAGMISGVNVGVGRVAGSGRVEAFTGRVTPFVLYQLSSHLFM